MIFDDVEFKHTWTINPDVWFVRLYCWVWETDTRDITFCKLFWAYVFMWLGLYMRLFALPFVRVLVWCGIKICRGSKRVFRLKREIDVDVIEDGITYSLVNQYESTALGQLLNHIVTGVSWVGMKVVTIVYPIKLVCQSTKNTYKRIGMSGVLDGPVGYRIENVLDAGITVITTVTWPLWKTAYYCVVLPILTFSKRIGCLDSSFGIAITISALIVTGIGLIAALISFINAILTSPLTILITLSGLLAWIILGIGLAWLFGLVTEDYVVPVTRQYIFKPSAKKTVGFGRVMLIGIKSVKSNTCPRIEMEEIK